MDYIFILIILITVLLTMRFNSYANYISICLAVILHILYNKPSILEHLTDTEAIKNIASLYEKGDFTVTNLKVTGNIDIGGYVKAGGPGTFGPAYIGMGENADWAEFAHVDRNNPIHKLGEGFNILKKNTALNFGGKNAVLGKANINSDGDWTSFTVNGDYPGYYIGKNGEVHIHGKPEMKTFINQKLRLSTFENKINADAPIVGGDLKVDVSGWGDNKGRTDAISQVVKLKLLNDTPEGTSLNVTPHYKYNNGNTVTTEKIWCIKQNANDSKNTSKILCQWYGGTLGGLPINTPTDNWYGTWMPTDA